MLGGIYGDLAADTWIRDRETFYRQLFDDRAKLSVYGRGILAQSWVLGDDDVFDSEKVIRMYQECRCLPCDLPDAHVMVKLGAVLFTVNAWWEGEVPYEQAELFAPRWFEKEEGYFRNFISKMIPMLLHGATKDEVYAALGNGFRNIRHNWDWRTEEGGMLNYLLRAWDCFYKAFDFGSAIHNAVKCVGDVRLNAVLTGMIAEAMYGCDMYFIKKKYAPEEYQFYHYLQLPKQIAQSYEPQLRIIRLQERWQNFFFKKNQALANVEWHKYTPVDNQFADKVITTELHRRILKAFQTGWEARYGLYLDNGWIYVYRSHCIIGRFRMSKLEDGTYRIVDTQESDEGYDFNMALNGAINTVDEYWPMDSDFDFKYFSLYYGEPKDDVCPYPADSNESRFWYGEKMFYETQIDNIGKWLADGRDSLRDRRNPKLYALAKRLGPESFAVAYYIDILFTKWQPMSDTNWILLY